MIDMVSLRELQCRSWQRKIESPELFDKSPELFDSRVQNCKTVSRRRVHGIAMPVSRNMSPWELQ